MDIPSSYSSSSSLKVSSKNWSSILKDTIKNAAYLVLLIALVQGFVYLLLRAYLGFRLNPMSDFSTGTDLLNSGISHYNTMHLVYLSAALLLGFLGLAIPLYKERMGKMKPFNRYCTIFLAVMMGAVGAWSQVIVMSIQPEMQKTVTVFDIYNIQKDALNSFLEYNPDSMDTMKSFTYESKQCTSARDNVGKWNKVPTNPVGALLQQAFNGTLYTSNCLKPQEFFDRQNAIRQAQYTGPTALGLMFPTAAKTTQLVISKLNVTPEKWCLIQPELKGLAGEKAFEICHKAKGPESLTHPLSLKEMGATIPGVTKDN